MCGKAEKGNLIQLRFHSPARCERCFVSVSEYGRTKRSTRISVLKKPDSEGADDILFRLLQKYGGDSSMKDLDVKDP